MAARAVSRGEPQIGLWYSRACSQLEIVERPTMAGYGGWPNATRELRAGNACRGEEGGEDIDFCLVCRSQHAKSSSRTGTGARKS